MEMYAFIVGNDRIGVIWPLNLLEPQREYNYFFLKKIKFGNIEPVCLFSMAIRLLLLL